MPRHVLRRLAGTVKKRGRCRDVEHHDFVAYLPEACGLQIPGAHGFHSATISENDKLGTRIRTIRSLDYPLAEQILVAQLRRPCLKAKAENSEKRNH